MITIIGINKLPFGLNWKSKLYILCNKNFLPTSCIKELYQHCDEPNIIDVSFYNSHSKNIFKTLLQNYVVNNNLNITII